MIIEEYRKQVVMGCGIPVSMMHEVVWETARTAFAARLAASQMERAAMLAA